MSKSKQDKNTEEIYRICGYESVQEFVEKRDEFTQAIYELIRPNTPVSPRELLDRLRDMSNDTANGKLTLLILIESFIKHIETERKIGDLFGDAISTKVAQAIYPLMSEFQHMKDHFTQMLQLTEATEAVDARELEDEEVPDLTIN